MHWQKTSQKREREFFSDKDDHACAGFTVHYLMFRIWVNDVVDYACHTWV